MGKDVLYFHYIDELLHVRDAQFVTPSKKYESA